MNNFIKISIIFCYILFAQVYPVVHWHAHEHQDEIELHICTHPPDLLTNENEADHDHLCTHEHEDTHFNGDWDYTIQKRTSSLKLAKQLLVSTNILSDPPKVYRQTTQEIEPKLPHDYLQVTFPDRAPPQLS